MERSDTPYLLHIDEIDRADLSKVLGEAIYLLEASEPERSAAQLHDSGLPLGSVLHLPRNLHIVGTMNSANSSIAILILAIRRRFAFARLWPQVGVVPKHGGPRFQEAFERLLSIFLERASDEAFDLMPGHGNFLDGEGEASVSLRTGVAPLLREYLRQGYVAGFCGRDTTSSPSSEARLSLRQAEESCGTSTSAERLTDALEYQSRVCAPAYGWVRFAF